MSLKPVCKHNNTDSSSSSDTGNDNNIEVMITIGSFCSFFLSIKAVVKAYSINNSHQYALQSILYRVCNRYAAYST